MFAAVLAFTASQVTPLTAVAQGQLPPPEQSLVDPAITSQLNALERAAAQANQRTYNALYEPCETQSPACTPEVRAVFEEARELVRTASEILGGRPIEGSLRLSIEGLGFALRWTAAEEMAAHGSSTTEFAASQLSSLSARLASLRWGVSGPRATYHPESGNESIRVADSGSFGRKGGGASGDAETVYSRWSWYVDGSFGYGDKEPTELEDAFDFDGQEITVGVDYRFSTTTVAGVMLGYTKKEVDFDSSKSIVDGGIETDGYSGLAYGLWEGERAYMNGALGYQQLTHDNRRRITYPSEDPTVPATDSLATSSTDSGSLLATVGAGYAFRWGQFSLQPSVDFAYTDASVDAFVERSVDLTQDASPDDPFDLRIGRQSIESLDASAGFKVDFVITPSFGVLVPYFTARYHREMLNDVRRISALYADAYELLVQDVADDPNFNVPTDEPDDDYYTLAGGLTVVLQGGLMGFVQYLEVLDLDHYSNSVITGGLRYEFGR
ncbi:MAG TPA: autotransporter outer membrane beta-barrel domain-containing protein [Steroidobacteraceae bacterium]|nr:autotransporter outer membrane beta-barrel domain-containing protein [Steroidobacteraceae bacterium]